MKKSKLKSIYAKELLASGIKAYSVIRHSYTNHKLNMGAIVISDNICPTLDTRCDCLAIVVEVEDYGNKNKEE